MTRRSLPRKVTYFEPVPPRLARNTIIESTFEVGRPTGKRWLKARSEPSWPVVSSVIRIYRSV